MSIQLFKKWTQAVVNSDWDSMSSLYAEDIVNLNPDGTTNEGKEACLEKDKGWDSAFSDFKFDVVNSYGIWKYHSYGSSNHLYNDR